MGPVSIHRFNWTIMQYYMKQSVDSNSIIVGVQDPSVPRITNACAATNTEIEVTYSMHPNLTELVTGFTLSYSIAGVSNSVSISLPPSAQGTVRVGGISSGAVVSVRLQTMIGTGVTVITPNTTIINTRM